MQVSWIDPDEVRDLLKQLELPKPASTASAWEVHTLPTVQVAPSDVEPLVGNHAPLPATAEAIAEPKITEERTGPANAELWRIRERLRALRDKAHSAGIFARNTLQEAPPVAPEPTSAEPQSCEVTEPPTPLREDIPADDLPPSIEPAETPLPEPIPSPQVDQEPSPVVELLFQTTGEPSSPTPDSVPDDLVEVEPSPMPQEPFSPTVSDQRHLPFNVPSQGLSDRLNAVAEWVCLRLGTREVLLVDDYGDVLWGDHRQTGLVLSAVMAWQSAQRASPSAACIDPERIDKPLPPDRALTVLPLRTKYGVVSLAVILPHPIGPETSTEIRQALALAVEGPSN